MKNKFKIKQILHSGRKGVRNTEVDAIKFYGMKDAIIFADLNDVNEFQSFRWDFEHSLHHPWYNWETSPVIAMAQNEETGDYLIETINTIYVLEPIESEQQ